MVTITVVEWILHFATSLYARAIYRRFTSLYRLKTRQYMSLIVDDEQLYQGLSQNIFITYCSSLAKII